MAGLQAMQSQIEQQKDLLIQLAPQKQKWEAKLKEVQHLIECIPGHALMTAAACSYLPPFPHHSHQQLWSNWLDYCRGSVSVGSLSVDKTDHQFSHGDQKPCVLVQESFTVQHVLASEEELRLWQQNTVFPHSTVLEKALIWRANRLFSGDQLFFISDPHDQFKAVLNALRTSESPFTDKKQERGSLQQCELEFLTTTDITTSEVTEKLSKGKVMVLATGPGDHQLEQHLVAMLGALPQKEPINHRAPQLVLLNSKSITSPVGSSNHIFTLPSMAVLNLELEEKGMSTLLLHHILQRARHQLWVQRRALLTDLNIHKQQLEQCQVSAESCSWI